MNPDRLLDATLALTSDSIVICDATGTIVRANAAASRLYGHALEHLVGQSYAQLLADESEWSDDSLLQLKSGAVAEQPMAKRRHRDGSTIQVSLKRHALCAEDGSIAAVVERGTLPFVSAQAEERFRLAVEACPAGMLLVSQSGNIIFANVAAEEMFGYDRAELQGQSVEMLIPQSLRAAHVHMRRQFVLKSGNQRMGHGRELIALRKDKNEFPVEISLRSVPANGDEYVLCVIDDITHRKIAESEMMAQREELERSNRDLEQFAYMASHDLQEPLRMVASYTELLRERYQGKLDEKADKYIGYAVDGAKRMQQLVADILAYSRVGSRNTPMQTVSLDKVLKGVLIALQEPIQSTGAIVEWNSLPAAIGDEMQLSQLFQNLVGNAIKFRGARTPQIRIRASRLGSRWQIEVVDNGIGFEAAYAEKIFLMFQRLHGREKYDGTGIGLAIAKRIVERHGGRIWAESKSPEGSTFYFTLQAPPGAPHEQAH